MSEESAQKHLETWFEIYRGDAIIDADLGPGEYRQVRRTQVNGRVLWAVLRCPACHKTVGVARRVHAVDALGLVTQSFKCSHDDCTFHRWIYLVDWLPEAEGGA